METVSFLLETLNNVLSNVPDGKEKEASRV
jgi:hypothetical protein